MCGRFSLSISMERLRELFLSPGDPPPALPADLHPLPPRYNICPTQFIPAIRLSPEGAGRDLAFFHWGLVPSWAKDHGRSGGMINARAETVAEKPSFRAAFRRRRCLVPADGFFEWKKEKGGAKMPYLIRFEDRRVFAFAGLWERWKGKGENPLESCTIITTTPNRLVEGIHDRMPVILEEKDYESWLHPEQGDPATILAPCPEQDMIAMPVSRRVNRPGFEGPECIEPAGPGPGLFD